MHTTLIFTFGILQVFLTLTLNYNNAVEFKFTNAVCESYNKSWIPIHTCRLKALCRNKMIFNFNGTILHDISVTGQLFKKANGFKPWPYKVNIDACQFLSKPFNPIVVLVYNLFKDFTNINHSCPLFGPQIISGFHLRHDLLRGLPVPTGDYLLAINYLFDKKLQSYTNLYFTFVEDL